MQQGPGHAARSAEEEGGRCCCVGGAAFAVVGVQPPRWMEVAGWKVTGCCGGFLLVWLVRGQLLLVFTFRLSRSNFQATLFPKPLRGARSSPYLSDLCFVLLMIINITQQKLHPITQSRTNRSPPSRHAALCTSSSYTGNGTPAAVAAAAAAHRYQQHMPPQAKPPLGPCKQQACDIQSCLASSDYQEERCIHQIAALIDCCAAQAAAGSDNPVHCAFSKHYIKLIERQQQQQPTGNSSSKAAKRSTS